MRFFKHKVELVDKEVKEVALEVQNLELKVSNIQSNPEILSANTYFKKHTNVDQVETSFECFEGDARVWPNVMCRRKQQAPAARNRGTEEQVEHINFVKLYFKSTPINVNNVENEIVEEKEGERKNYVPQINCKVEGMEQAFLIDTGSAVSVMSTNLFEELKRSNPNIPTLPTVGISIQG
ncbi:hypothetical protein FQR65_LT06834 [Abscondita terminalis]|nr:hypothetical protein FQR65_LT06834 [Abscondita terminalis]